MRRTFWRRSVLLAPRCCSGAGRMRSGFSTADRSARQVRGGQAVPHGSDLDEHGGHPGHPVSSRAPARSCSCCSPKAASRDAVASRGYALRATPPTRIPLSYKFGKLLAPPRYVRGQIAVYVLDQGDTCEARHNPIRGGCVYLDGMRTTASRISRSTARERVRLVGGALRTMAEVQLHGHQPRVRARHRGRQRGHIYVAGTAIVLVPGTGPIWVHAHVSVPHLSLPSSRQRRRIRIRTCRSPRTGCVTSRTRFAEGSGIGTILDPRGIIGRWIHAGRGRPLRRGLRQELVAETQRRPVPQRATEPDRRRQTRHSPIPLDVSVDRQGYIYVATPTIRRVLRYDPYWRVRSKGQRRTRQRWPRADQARLRSPVDDSLAYVADRAAGRVVRYRRRD
jgi:hypothetical protein